MQKLIVLSALFISFVAQAGSLNYQAFATSQLSAYFEEINEQALAAPATPERCAPMYRRALERGVFDIRYALGYFDNSTGEDIVYQGVNFGRSPSFDIEVYNAIRAFLTKACVAGSPQQLCGFSETGDPRSGMVVLTKDISTMGSRPVQTRITLTQASASENFLANTTTGGSTAARQVLLTSQSERYYFGGVGAADVVFYNGHSRNGGGPDFRPPRLNAQGRADYRGYYEVQRPGFTRLLEAIRQAGDHQPILGLFSCYSRRHFSADLMRVNPDQRVIFSQDNEIQYIDSLTASMGYLEGFMQGRCGQDLANLAKQGATNPEGFEGVNLR